VGNPAAGKSFVVANAATAFGSLDGNSIYAINDNRWVSGDTIARRVVQINMQTNEVTFKCNCEFATWAFYGRIFRDMSNFGNPIRGYAFAEASDGSRGGVYIFNPDANTFTQQTLWAGYQNDLIVSMSVGNIYPTFWALYGSPNAGTYGNWPNVRWRKHEYNGTLYTHTFVGNTVDLSTIVGGSELVKYFGSTTTAMNLDMWDYNHIKKRYYIMSSADGYLHILKHNTGDMVNNWNASDISYEKTLAIPLTGNDLLSDSTVERWVVDYHPDTGEERGIIMNRRGNQSFTGCINYINWPE
jgi:hypothetical protein